MENWIIEIMEKFGYLGILLLITVENLFPPIPSEVILTFGGFMTSSTKMTIVGVVIVSTIGSVLGAVILYGIGKFMNVERLEKIIEKYGYILRLTKEDLHKASKWFEKHGNATVFFCRFIPLIRSLISIPAGMNKMNFGIFVLLTTVGTLIWNLVLVYLGASLGDNWSTVVTYMDTYSHIMYAVIVLIFLVFCSWFVKTKVLKREKSKKENIK